MLYTWWGCVIMTQLDMYMAGMGHYDVIAAWLMGTGKGCFGP
jgi:hypothetical protein